MPVVIGVINQDVQIVRTGGKPVQADFQRVRVGGRVLLITDEDGKFQLLLAVGTDSEAVLAALDDSEVRKELLLQARLDTVENQPGLRSAAAALGNAQLGADPARS